MIAEPMFQSQCHIHKYFIISYLVFFVGISCPVLIRLVFVNVCGAVEATFSLHRCASHSFYLCPARQSQIY